MAATNATFDEQYFCHPAPLWMRLISIAIGIVCTGVGGLSTLTTLCAFVKSRHTLWKISNINIFCLSVVDCINSTYVSSLFLEMYWFGCWLHIVGHCHTFLWVVCFTYHGSLALIALIAYDRYLMVKLGALYDQSQSLSRVLFRTICFGLAWPAFLGAITAWYNVISGFSINTNKGDCVVEIMQNVIAYQLMIWLGLGLPLGIMVVCYVTVYLRLHNRAVMNRTKWMNVVQPHASPPQVVDIGSTCPDNIDKSAEIGGVSDAFQQRQLRYMKRTARILNALFGMVLITNVPFVALTVVMTVIQSGYAPSLDATWWNQLFLLTQQFGWVNNAVNPLLYAHTMPEFHRAMADVWRPLLSYSRRLIGYLRHASSGAKESHTTWNAATEAVNGKVALRSSAKR